MCLGNIESVAASGTDSRLGVALLLTAAALLYAASWARGERRVVYCLLGILLPALLLYVHCLFFPREWFWDRDFVVARTLLVCSSFGVALNSLKLRCRIVRYNGFASILCACLVLIHIGAAFLAVRRTGLHVAMSVFLDIEKALAVFWILPLANLLAYLGCRPWRSRTEPPEPQQ